MIQCQTFFNMQLVQKTGIIKPANLYRLESSYDLTQLLLRSYVSPLSQALQCSASAEKKEVISKLLA